MHRIIWYRQKRVDGGIRTGVEVDGRLLFHRFDHKSDEPDPVLLWFVDLRCEGPRLPADPHQVRHFFVQHSAIIRSAFQGLSEELGAGIDLNAWPLQRKVSGFPPRVLAQIVLSTTGRQNSLAIPEVLKDIAEHWEDDLRVLPVIERSEAG